MTKFIETPKRLGIKDRFLIVKLALQHAVDPNTESYMFAIKKLNRPKITVSRYTQFKGDEFESSRLNLVTEWLADVFISHCKTVEDVQRPLTGLVISITKQWQLKTGYQAPIAYASPIVKELNEPQEE